VDQNQLLDCLQKLSAAQLEELIFRLGIPPELLPGRAPIETAIAIIRFISQQERLADLEAYLTRASAKAPPPAGGPSAGGAPAVEVELKVPAGIAAQAVEVRIKILFLGASPSDQVRLALGTEVRAIDRNLRESAAGRRFDLVQEWAVRARDLQTVLLRYRPQIVHFSGHGSRVGELCFEDDAGLARTVAVSTIARLFEVLGKDIRCVVLNACYSQVQAEAIRDHVDCVVGMTDFIDDPAAVAFASSFYLALGYGESAKAAFDLGCNQIDLSGLTGASLPILLHRPAVDPATVKVGPGGGVSRDR